MSTVPKPHRWTREQYERVVRLGGFEPDQRLELIDGEIVEMAPQNEPHAAALCLLHDALRRAYGDGHVVRVQSPVALDAGSAPEPDIAIVPGRPRDFLTSHPRHAVLLVEIADTTLAYDRSTKRLLYARNGVPEYWLLNLVQGGSRSTSTRKAPTISTTGSRKRVKRSCQRGEPRGRGRRSPAMTGRGAARAHRCEPTPRAGALARADVLQYAGAGALREKRR